MIKAAEYVCALQCPIAAGVELAMQLCGSRLARILMIPFIPSLGSQAFS